VTDPRSASTTAPPGANATPLPAAAAHPQVRHWLGQLDELVDHMARDGWDGWARERARAVIDFFGHTGRQLRRDEELLLFPLVAGRGDAALDAKVERLLQDHGWLEENWGELVSELRPIAEGFGTTDADVLRHAAEVYAANWLEHLDLVERVIHPAALAAHASPESAAAFRVARAAGLQALDS
jgi:hemerythrin-like domain-containing protein